MGERSMYSIIANFILTLYRAKNSSWTTIMSLHYSVSLIAVLYSTSYGQKLLYSELMARSLLISKVSKFLKQVDFWFLASMDRNIDAIRKFRESADLFVQANAHPANNTTQKFNTIAAKLLESCQDWTKAADLYITEGEFSKAGECFRTDKKYDSAAICYAKISIFI